jgi:hypothetical protein
MCAVLTELGKFDLAKEFANGAIINLNEEPTATPHEELLATAHYNLGVVNEHMKNYSEAHLFYSKSKYG